MSMTKLRRGAIAIALAVLAPITAVATTTATPAGAALPACTKTWTNTAGGMWDTAASWSGGTVPTDADHVCITTPGTYTVVLPDGLTAVTVASLRLGNAEPGTDVQTLSVRLGVDPSGTSLTATAGIEVRDRAVLELGESLNQSVAIGVGEGAVLANDGSLRQASGSEESHTIRGDVLNTGTLALDRSMRITGTLTTEGALQVNHVLHVEDTLWTKAGTVRGDWIVVAYDGFRIGDADTDQSAGAPAFTIEGGALSIEGDSPISLTVRNAVTLTGDSHPGQYINIQALPEHGAGLTSTGTWTNRGDLSIEPSGVMVATVVADEIVNEGTIARFDNDGQFAQIEADVVNRGTIDTGDRPIGLYGDLRNEGTLDLGNGGITSATTVTLAPQGVVMTEVAEGGAGSVSGHGALAVDGALVVDTPDGAAPGPGQGFAILDGGTRAGTFDDIRFTGVASYDPVYAAKTVAIVQRASESTTKRFVRAAFQDFLGRQPTTTELDQRAAAIDGGTLTRATFVRQLSLSPEYVTALVQRFYADTLGRPGDPDGVAFWVDQLRTGRKSVAEVAGSFYASGEYFTRAGGTNQAWITDLYGVFFDRPPTSGDLTYWTGRIAARGRTRVAIELFQSLESRRQRVDRLYLDLLGRESDAAGRDFWAGRITSAGDLALAVNLASSAEYLDRAEVRYP